MNRLVALIGFLSGILVTTIVLLNNPVSSAGLSGAAGANAYRWNILEFAGNSYNPAGLMGFPGGGAESLGADSVALANASIMLMQDENGEPVALATRLSSVTKGGDVLSGNVGTDTYTNIFWPNRGSVFMQGYENRWPLIRNKIVKMFNSSEQTEFAVSSANQGSSEVGIVGGSGQLVGLGGRYSETLREDPDRPGYYVGSISLDTPPE